MLTKPSAASTPTIIVVVSSRIKVPSIIASTSAVVPTAPPIRWEIKRAGDMLMGLV